MTKEEAMSDEKKVTIRHEENPGASVVVSGGSTTDRPQAVEVEHSPSTTEVEVKVKKED